MCSNFGMKTLQQNSNGIIDVAKLISEELSIHNGLLTFILHFKNEHTSGETILR